ncbi:H-NS family nucleoid-associated regulatory protein [Burkholderia cepacia]|uniref:H-NS family nucleoid-associated regulatory protein n=1 Tax=Burkholderia cepacia TaxID=292 RepID=UPI000B29EA5A|nr:H-NS family nucleoid-associated regulatory protein [Burkholderia cepacia]
MSAVGLAFGKEKRAFDPPGTGTATGNYAARNPQRVGLHWQPEEKAQGAGKYCDPKSGKSWSGYGPKPKWVEGKDLDALLVDRGQPQPWWPERDSQV